MKIISIIFLLACSICYGQDPFPAKQSMGSPKTEVYGKGALGSDSGYVFRYNFPDTSALSLGPLKNRPNLLILANDTLWKRNNAATAWVKQSGGTGGASADLAYTPGASSGIVTNTAGTDATIPGFTVTDAGLVPAASGGNLGTEFLGKDGTWKVPPGGSGGPTGVDFIPTTRSKDAAEIVGANLQTYKYGHNTPGVIPQNVGRIIDRGPPEVVPFHSVYARNGRYVAFPQGTSSLDVIWYTFKNALDHVSPASLPLMISYDGGAHVDSLNLIYAFGNDPGVTAISDSLFMFCTSGYTTNILIFYSIDGGRTIVLTDSVDQAGEANYPFDKFLKLPSGKITFTTYGLDGSNYYIRTVSSTDNGVSWDWDELITSGTLAGPINLNECSWDIVNEPTSNATTKILMVIRDEFLDGPQQWTSSDGGDTWTFRGTIEQLDDADDTYGFPVYVIKYGKDVYLVTAPRTTVEGASTAPDFYITSMRGVVDSVFTDPTKWPLPNVLYKSQDSYRGVGDYFDFGYSYPFIYNDVLLAVFYDVNALRDPPDIWTTIKTMRVVGINGLDLFAVANQTIPDVTETLVSTPRVKLDTENSYNSATGLIEIKKDGYYDIHAVCAYASSTDGTFRRAYIKVIDPGETTANRIIAEDFKQPTNAPDFLRFELRVTEFLHAGEKVGFYTEQNGGTFEELNNQGAEKLRSKLSIKGK